MDVVDVMSQFWEGWLTQNNGTREVGSLLWLFLCSLEAFETGLWAEFLNITREAPGLDG